MGIFDMFKPYSPKQHGDLLEYLRTHDGGNASSHFFGPKWFFEIRKREWMIPEATWVRVGQNPFPDRGYFVNSKGKLRGPGEGEHNMSLVGGEKGIMLQLKY
jgi:hypothetical protein